MIESRRAPSRTSRHPAAAFALAALALLAPAAAHAANKTFAAGSIIIPVQQEYQTDTGMMGAYGLVYAMLRHTGDVLPAPCVKPVTFYWTIAPNKLSHHRCDTNTNTLPSYATYNDNDGCDFAVQSADGVPVAEVQAAGTELAPFSVWHTAYQQATGPGRGTLYQVSPVSSGTKKTVMKYLGGPWVIDSTDRQCFLALLNTYPELAQYHTNGTGSATYVHMHSTRASFTAPVARILNQRPLLVAVTGGKSAFMENVLINAGLNAIPNYNAGVVYDSLTESQLLDTTATDPYGRLNNGKYGLFWGSDGMCSGGTCDGSATLTSQERGNLNYFIDLGNGAYVEASSIDILENDTNYPPLIAAPPQPATNDSNPNVPYAPDCNDRKSGVSTFHATGNNDCFTYSAMNHPWTQTGNWPFNGGQGFYKAFTTNNGVQAGAMLGVVYGATANIAAARYKDNDQTKGLVIYLAGMRFDNARFWGERMIMNSVLANVPLILGVELARSEPVGYHDASVSPATDRVYQGTYYQMPDPPEAYYRDYSTDFPQRWRFPYTVGHLYEYDLSDIPVGSMMFACGSGSVAGTCPTPNWDAGAKLPQSPTARNIFTTLAGSGPLGWQRVSFDYKQTRAGCLDADGDGKCDLSEALAQCNTAGVITETLQGYASTDSTQRDQLGMFVQQVRGHCSAHTPAVTGTPIMEPTNGQCDDPLKQKNVAQLGGLDHGSPAIVGPSRYVTGAQWVNRPVVAYAGARDGMLHAFYVSGGSTWKNPQGVGLPSGVKKGQELWAYLPPGQLCNLATNNAMVDASVNVIDVFADFPHDANHDGVIDWTSADERPNHIREWHTVLLAAAGEGGSELFALDVTDPLSPVLLWHLSGTTENDGRFDTNGDGKFETFSKSDPNTYAVKWFDWDDRDGSTDYIPTNYDTTSSTVLDDIKFGGYDYRNLGLTYGTAVGKVSVGDSFQYVGFVATGMVDYTDDSPLGFRGLEMFALDLVTGKKLWQWEKAYTRKRSDGTPIADDTIPGRVALGDVNSDGSVDRIYVGDLEGHLWELDARTGRNLNWLPDRDGTYHSFPLFGTIPMTGAGPPAATPDIMALFQVNGTSTVGQQPLTSPIGLGRFTQVQTALMPYFTMPVDVQNHLIGRLAIVQGAMGVDWPIAPFEPGSVYVIPVAPETGTRLDTTATTADPAALMLSGVLDPKAAWRIPLKVGERVFGMPRIVNNEVIFNTAFGSFSGDITETITEAGNLYEEGVTSTGAKSETITKNQSKSFGGVLVFDNTLIVTTDSGITQKALPSELKSDGSADTRPFNRTTPAVYRTWEPGSFTTP